MSSLSASGRDITPTEEQEACIKAVPGKDSLMISAYAGCAKTSTLELMAPKVRVPTLALAFNKKIALDMAPRLPGNFTVKTLNALGHQAWQRVTGPRLQLDDRKIGKLTSQVARDRKVELSSDQWDGLRRLVTGAMQAGLVPSRSGPDGFVPDTREAWWEVADTQLMFQEDFDLVWELGREILELDIELARKGQVSFDDQIYCSVMLGGQFPKFPVLFVDEAQDLSPLNHAMLAKASLPDAKIVAVGDEKQAIYAFRGASGDSMRRIRQMRDRWSDLPLAITFRCPKAVVARQQDHAPGFRAWHTNADGTIARLGTKATYDAEEVPWTWAQIEALRPAPSATVAVLCRNNGPLVSLAFKLLRAQVPVVMLGRDIGKGLVALLRKLAPNDDVPAETVLGFVDAWAESEVSLARANGREEKVAGITDRAECLVAIITGAGCRDAGEARAMCGKLFEREHGRVTLGSIHRAKGLEWDLVVHLDPWRIPSKWARASAAEGDPVPLMQEHNLRYVAETRTKHTLVLADLDGFQTQAKD